MRVTLGVWINEWEEQNEREIESAIALAKQLPEYRQRHRRQRGGVPQRSSASSNPAIRRTVRDLIAKIQRVKREVRVPVTTAEVPNVWLEYPGACLVRRLSRRAYPALLGRHSGLARGRPCARTVYERLRQAYPGKRIVIAEFGWPSAGLNRKDAVPSPLTQAEVVRDFVTRADAMGIDYSIVEAFDQPWKTNEGSVGPYWGIFNADRHPKFALAGTVEDAELPAAR